ncbi:MAG: EAL domain-containing protein [Colwellia sp.]|nr:EAL domain-containing protein [Colwellia sp.]
MANYLKESSTGIQQKNSADNAISSVEEIAKLQLELKNLAARHTALFKLNQLSHDCLTLEEFFPQVHAVIASLITAPNFFIVMYEQTFSTLEFVYSVDENDDYPDGPVDYERYKGSLTHLVIESGQALLATPEIISRLSDEKLVIEHGTSGLDWLGVPLINDGLVIGVMVVQSYNEHTRYQDEDLNLLTFAAQHLVTAMTRLEDHQRLQSAVNARTRELMEQIRDRERSDLLQESLFKISELTNDASLDIDEFYHQVHNIVGQMLNATNFFIVKYDQESETAEFVYQVDEYEEIVKYLSPRKLSNLFCDYVIRKGETVLLDYQQMLALYQQGITAKPSSESHSWLGVPLIYFKEVIGVMVIQSYQSNITFSQQDAELLNFVSQHVSTAIKRREAIEYERQSHELLEQQVKLRTVALEDEIIQRKRVETQLKHTASHDSLTGLPNRMVFIDLLNHAIATNKRKPDLQFAILFLDLDRFKVVNDSLGHHAGDLLLKIVARELTEIVRGKDTVARLGGDEFVILVEDLENNNEAFEVAQRITEFLKQPFTIDNQLVFIGTSIGILFSDARYENANTMLRDADTAMYHAKDNGKGRYEVFDGSMHNKVQNALSLEADLREAIEWQEFIPYFQPILKLSNNQIMGFEALARWHSTKRGLVYPNDFIPLAEDTNLVLAIDLQILEKSCLQLKKWQEQLGRNNLYVSCNLFCKHFFSTTLPDDINNILVKVGLAPKNLRIEITERALMENSDVVLGNMKALKHLGIKILLDDFGTGYSSLSYLHRFPIDVLKIDRSFITNVHEHENNRAIIKTIIDLATNLQMSTIGEGIENIADAELLQQLDCLYGQGYFYAKPMPAEQALDFIQRSNLLE